MKPEPIQMWKAPDGTIHETEAMAYQHINKEKAKEKLTSIVDEFDLIHYDSDELCNFLLTHAKQIGDILEEWRGI